jgi:hypothetical protein
MIHTRIALLAALAATSPLAPAQVLTLSAGAVPPGTPVTANIFNDTTQSLSFADGCGLQILRSTGEIVGYPFTPPQVCDGIYSVPPGTSRNILFTAPATPGSYDVVFAWLPHAAARLDVAGAPPSSRTLNLHSVAIGFPQNAHAIDFSTPSNTPWEFTSVAASAHTFGAGSRVDLFTPGGFAPVASLNLSGLTVPAGKATHISLPVGGLVPGPYRLVATYDDPGVGGFVQTRTGIRDQGSRADLHMATGNVLPIGGSIGANLVVEDLPFAPGQDPVFVVLIGILPGTTVLPDGTMLPLVADGLFDLSLSSGVGGLLQNYFGTLSNFYGPGSFFGFAGVAQGISFTNPNLPGLTGLTVHMAGLAVDAGWTTWAATQPEDIVFG